MLFRPTNEPVDDVMIPVPQQIDGGRRKIVHQQSPGGTIAGIRQRSRYS